MSSAALVPPRMDLDLIGSINSWATLATRDSVIPFCAGLTLQVKSWAGRPPSAPDLGVGAYALCVILSWLSFFVLYN